MIEIFNTLKFNVRKLIFERNGEELNGYMRNMKNTDTKVHRQENQKDSVILAWKSAWMLYLNHNILSNGLIRACVPFEHLYTISTACVKLMKIQPLRRQYLCNHLKFLQNEIQLLMYHLIALIFMSNSLELN